MNTRAAILITSSCLVVSSAVGGSAAKPSSNAPQTGLVLDQTHVYLGKMKVFLTPKAIKMKCLGKFHFALVSKAPNWNVTVYREEDKLYCTETLSEFCDQGLFSNIVLVQKNRMVPPGGTFSKSKFCGFSIEKYTWDNAVFGYMRTAPYAPPQAEQIFHFGYKVPTQGQIPITYEGDLSGKDWMTNLPEKGMHRVFLGTKKISVEKIPASEFDIPSGMKKEKSVTRIVIGDAKKLKDTGVGVLFGVDK